MSKDEAIYREQQQDKDNHENSEQSCDKFKFNLSVEQICHIVEGAISNERGISRNCAPKDEGLLPSDIVWGFCKEDWREIGLLDGGCYKCGYGWLQM